MTGLRAVRRRFILVAIVAVVPIGLLVWRALASVAAETRLQHRTVAERIFDEMERALSTVLAAEEDRPFDGWVAASSSGEWVLRRFQVDPDGTLRTAEPRQPIDATLVAFWVRDGGAPVGANGAETDQAQRPGSTVGLAPAGAAAEVATKQGRSYDALSSLNKAVEQRAARQELKRKGAAKEAAAPAAMMADARTPSSRDDVASSPPMVGQRLDGERVMLFRTVVRAGRAYRQGLVLAVAPLGAWLRDQALDDATRATVTFAGTAEAGPDDGGAYVYRHRFAEPFADVSARLDLPPLAGRGGASWVYALGALLVLAVGLGLVALYRMVAVTVAFAERRSNFVAAVSHELKTPLTAIRMYGEMLRDGIVPSEAKRDEYHRHITAESERLSRLINNVLEFARLEKGTRAMALTVGPIRPVIDEAVTLLAPHAEQAGFMLRLDAQDDLPPVRFERDAVLQMLFNLVDNAIKYAAEAARKDIVVRLRRDGAGVRVSVRDHGPGVPAAHLGQVFEPFYRGERELTRRTKGTGIGLALVRGLADAMGAGLTGRNVVDGGFEVEIALGG